MPRSGAKLFIQDSKNKMKEICDVSELRVAIVVLVFNVQRYLLNCLESIDKQTFRNFTVFAINDFSTDNSAFILDEYAKTHPWLQVVHKDRLGVSKGVSSTRNIALDLIKARATFDFVGFIDSDDEVEPNYLERLVATAVRRNVDVVICGYSLINENGDPLPIKDKKPSEKYLGGGDEFVELIFSCLRWSGANGAGGMLWKQIFRSSLLDDVRLLDDVQAVEDELFCLKVAAKSNAFFCIPERLYKYRVRSDSLVRRKDFLLMLVNGRKYCLNVAKGMSHRIEMLVVSKYINTAIDAMRDMGYPIKLSLSPNCDRLISEAFDSGVVGEKTFRLYKLYCLSPVRFKIYLTKHYFCKRIRALVKCRR